MFTLIRPVSAVFLAIFAYFAALAFWPLHLPGVEPGFFPWYPVRVAAVVGWLFVGGGIGRKLWYSVYITVQGVALTVIGTAMYMAVGEVFLQGYRRRYPEVTDAIAGYFEIVMAYIAKTFDRDFLLLLLAGGVVIGLVLHGVFHLMERRRNDR